MLGQIEFAPWQCLAELIDNSIDGFTSAGRRLPPSPTISIELPAAGGLNDEDAALVIRDNAPGMTAAELENSARAGFSGNKSTDKLGLFGMGFNISTARLGRRTTIWTTTADDDEWTGLEIDFDRMEKEDTFLTPPLKRDKTDSEIEGHEHGTQVVITKIEKERLSSLVRGSGQKRTKERLSQLYGQVLDKLGITIEYNRVPIVPWRHCVWSQDRFVEHAEHGRIYAQIPIDESLPPANFCELCWVWLEEQDATCPACDTSTAVVERDRVIKGWVGIQRYFDKDDFGIDLIRNGRVIERYTKDFFTFEFDDGDTRLDYPLEAKHWGGRIIGELEIDFVRVSHQKDAFDKTDRNWRAVYEVVRGVSPLQPDIAKKAGYPPNTSPVAKLFYGYRRGDMGRRWLVPGKKKTKSGEFQGENATFMDAMVEKFHAGDPDYQTDEKWFEMVELAERAKRGLDTHDDEEDVLDEDEFEDDEDPDEPPEPEQPMLRREDEELSGEYVIEQIPSCAELTVTAYIAHPGLDDALENRPFSMRIRGAGLEYIYNPEHSYFDESLDTPVDGMVRDMAHQFLLRSGQNPEAFPMALLERYIREKYFPETLTTVEQTVAEAESFLDDLRTHLAEHLEQVTPIDVDGIHDRVVAMVRKGVLAKNQGGEQEALETIRDGLFIEYVDYEFLVSAVEKWPELIFDGVFVVNPYANADVSVREQSIPRLQATINHVIWLTEEAGGGALQKNPGWRHEFSRAVASVRLLETWKP